MQNEKVPETIGRSNNFEGHMIAKSEIVKIRWKYVSFLTTQNRHVRQTAGIIVRKRTLQHQQIQVKNRMLIIAFSVGKNRGHLGLDKKTLDQ